MFKSKIDLALTWPDAESLLAAREQLVASIGQEKATARAEYWIVEFCPDTETTEG